MLTTYRNFRDLGGGRTAAGQRVVTGQVFRSEALLEPSVADAARVAALGLRLVCDLRSDSERAHAPNNWFEAVGVHCREFDLLAAIPSADGPWAILSARPTPVGARDAMLALYAAMPAAAGAHMATIIGLIVDGQSPLLIHCTAGKDRTGFVSAVLLAALGISRDIVTADYLASTGQQGPAAIAHTRELVRFRTGQAVNDATVAILMGVSPSYISAAWDNIDAAYGDVPSYLAAFGVNAGELSEFRARLLK